MACCDCWASTRKANDEHVSSEELRTIVTEAGQLIPARHRGMLLNILDLEEVSVDDIMVPRNEVYGIDLDDSDDDILRCIQTSSHTRLPVWREDINNIVGVLHMRNISRVIDSRDWTGPPWSGRWKSPTSSRKHPAAYPAAEFPEKKKPLAVVVDEYGEVLGLVALEDILEEIVGEFTSNLAETDGQYFPAARRQLHHRRHRQHREINKSLDWELPTDGPKTLSGLILENLESFPMPTPGSP